MIGEFTEKAKTYENIAKANGVELTKEVRNAITDFLTYEDQLIEKDAKVQTLESSKYIKSQREMQRHFDKNNYGDFYFNFYEGDINKIEPKNLTRVLYLCTYMDYSNRLVLKKSKFNHVPMDNKDIMKILGLSKMEYYRTKKELIDNNILIEKDEIYYISELICKRGVIVENKKDSKVRTFDDSIKELYEKANPKEHKFLSLIYKILPYINYNHNIICKNPKEENIKLVQPFTVKEFADLFGYKNQTVFKNNLLKLTIKGEPVVLLAYVFNKSSIFINPKVYYKGNDVKAVSDIEKKIDVVMSS